MIKESGKEKKARVFKIIKLLEQATKGMQRTASAQIIARYGKDPYLILISCLLSLRTRDTVSFPASCRLFEYAKTPQEMLKLSISTIEKLIYPVGFYKNKARSLQSVSADLLKRFNGKVPKTQDELLSIKGVGQKTANLVLGQAFGIPAICVDTHVHKVSNRLGLVKTKTPQQTEAALKELLPKSQWISFNDLLVLWGQNICVPVSPKCSSCVLLPLCPQIGVTTHR